MKKHLFLLGDLYATELPEFDNFIFRDSTVVYNQEFVLSNNQLTPEDNRVNLCGYYNVARDIFGSARMVIANISNNHINDYGISGIESTIELLHKDNINCYGEFIKKQENFIYEIEGYKVAFLGYYMHAFTKNEEIELVKKKLKDDIMYAKKGADRVIVSFHYGNEHYPSASDEQREVSHYAIDNGASLIIGHHPHCIQNVEIYKEKYIFYSLGNFYFENTVVDAFYRKGKMPIKFMLKTMWWMKKSIVVGYELDTEKVEIYVTTQNKQTISIKKSQIKKYFRVIPTRQNVIIGEARKLILLVCTNLFVNGKIIYLDGLKHKFEKVRESGRFKILK